MYPDLNTLKDFSPKVTVIVPNYNHERFLRKRLQSVFNQTYQNFEVIYLDDASTDRSSEVFSEFANDERIVQTEFNEVNSGSPFKQWNKGVRLSRGEYIWIAEADDYADERLLESLVNQLNSHPKVGLAYCQSWCVDEDDNVSSTMKWCTDDLDSQRWMADFVADGKEECSRYLSVKNTIPNASAVLIRKSVYERVGYAGESLNLAGDWMLWVKILLVSDIAFVAAPLNYFRKHTQSVRSKSIITGVELEERYIVLSHILSQLQLEPKQIRIAFDYMTYPWINLALSRRLQIPWSRNRRIYNLASRIDPSARKWLVKVFITELLRKLMLLDLTVAIVKFVRGIHNKLFSFKTFRHTNR